MDSSSIFIFDTDKGETPIHTLNLHNSPVTAMKVKQQQTNTNKHKKVNNQTFNKQTNKQTNKHTNKQTNMKNMKKR